MITMMCWIRWSPAMPPSLPASPGPPSLEEGEWLQAAATAMATTQGPKMRIGSLLSSGCNPDRGREFRRRSSQEFEGAAFPPRGVISSRVASAAPSRSGTRLSAGKLDGLRQDRVPSGSQILRSRLHRHIRSDPHSLEAGTIGKDVSDGRDIEHHSVLEARVACLGVGPRRRLPDDLGTVGDLEWHQEVLTGAGALSIDQEDEPALEVDVGWLQRVRVHLGIRRGKVDVLRMGTVVAHQRSAAELTVLAPGRVGLVHQRRLEMQPAPQALVPPQVQDQRLGIAELPQVLHRIGGELDAAKERDLQVGQTSLLEPASLRLLRRLLASLVGRSIDSHGSTVGQG